MSYHWIETAQSQNIPITSIRCLMSALVRLDAKLTKIPQSYHDLIIAEKRLKSAQNYHIQANSIKQSKKLADYILKEIEANNFLLEALKKAEIESPKILRISSSSGRIFELKRKAGAYKITWINKKEQHSQSGHVRDRINDHESKKFAQSLSSAYRNEESNHLAELKKSKKRMKDFDFEAKKRMEQAIRIRTHWERIEEARKLKLLRSERTNHVVEKATKLGFKAEVKEIDDEIIIIGTHISLDTASSSNSDPFSTKYKF